MADSSIHVNNLDEESSPRGRKFGNLFRTSSPKVKDEVKKLSDDVLFLLNSFQSTKEEIDRLKKENKQLKWQVAQLSGSVRDIEAASREVQTGVVHSCIQVHQSTEHSSSSQEASQIPHRTNMPSLEEIRTHNLGVLFGDTTAFINVY